MFGRIRMIDVAVHSFGARYEAWAQEMFLFFFGWKNWAETAGRDDFRFLEQILIFVRPEVIWWVRVGVARQRFIHRGINYRLIVSGIWLELNRRKMCRNSGKIRNNFFKKSGKIAGIIVNFIRLRGRWMDFNYIFWRI